MAFTLKDTRTQTDQLSGITVEQIQLPPASTPGLREMLKQLGSLTNPEDYDDEFVTPSTYAMNRVRDLLVEASERLSAAFPLGTIYADGVGGIRIEWIRPDQELRLIVSRLPVGRQYIYHEQRDEYAADYSPDSLKLSEWLKWLQN